MYVRMHSCMHTYVYMHMCACMYCVGMYATEVVQWDVIQCMFIVLGSECQHLSKDSLDVMMMDSLFLC